MQLHLIEEYIKENTSTSLEGHLSFTVGTVNIRPAKTSDDLHPM